jgi:hypothetical protein
MEGLFKIEGRIYVLVLEQRFLTSSILSNFFFTLDPPYAALTAGDLSVIDIQSKVPSLGMLDTVCTEYDHTLATQRSTLSHPAINNFF